MTVLKKIFPAVLLCVLAFLFTVNADADISPGGRVGVYFDAESAFIGGEVAADITESWTFVPNVEFVFIDNASFTTFNFDFQYNFETDYSFEIWAGAGPAILYFNPEDDQFDSDTEFGANLFFGIGFPLRDMNFIPYVQPKIILADNVEFVLAFGLRF